MTQCELYHYSEINQWQFQLGPGGAFHRLSSRWISTIYVTLTLLDALKWIFLCWQRQPCQRSQASWFASAVRGSAAGCLIFDAYLVSPPQHLSSLSFALFYTSLPLVYVNLSLCFSMFCGIKIINFIKFYEL